MADRHRSKWPMLLNTSGARCIPTFITEFPAAAMQQRVQIQRLPTCGSNSADFISSQLVRFYPFFQDKKFSLIFRLKSVQTGQKTIMWRHYVANYGYSDGQYVQSNPLGHSLCAVEGVWSRISQCNRRQRKNIISFFLSFFLGWTTRLCTPRYLSPPTQRCFQLRFSLSIGSDLVAAIEC